MKRVSSVQGKAIPIDRVNVDTDQIIPAKHLKRIERTGYGPFAFEAWRSDPNFVINNPAYTGAKIMITRQNFGSGSSREHAVWALEGLGIEALIGTSFADIFRNNSFQGGLLTIELPEKDIDYLMARAEELPDSEVIVDLPSQTVRTADGQWERHFEIDASRKHRLQHGLDDISMTLEDEVGINEFEKQRTPLKPSTLTVTESA